MAEFRYGYRTQFDEPTPVEEYTEPQFHKPNARVTASNPHAANLLSKLPLKDPTITFNINLQQNTGSDPSKPIDAPTLFDKVSCMLLMNISFLISLSCKVYGSLTVKLYIMTSSEFQQT